MVTSRPTYTLVNLTNAFLAGPWTLRSLSRRTVHRPCPDIQDGAREFISPLYAPWVPNLPPSFDALLAFVSGDPWISSFRHSLIGEHFWLPLVMAAPRDGRRVVASAHTHHVRTVGGLGWASPTALGLACGCPRLDRQAARSPASPLCLPLAAAPPRPLPRDRITQADAQNRTAALPAANPQPDPAAPGRARVQIGPLDR